MTRYGQHVSARKTPQHEPARADQVKNSAGGHVFQLDKWKRLDRFLILGAEGGTYYASEKKLVKENAKCLAECIAEDGPRVVRRLVEISDSGRAPKNDPAIFALAMCAGAGGSGIADSKYPATRQAALLALPKVCRIGTHLFHFVADVENFRGWGPALKKAVARWYTGHEPGNLAYDLVKYQQRDGWGHRDLIRLSHPKAPTPAHKAAIVWSARGKENLSTPTKRFVRATKTRGQEIVEAISRGPHDQRGTPASEEHLPKIISAFEEIPSSRSISSSTGSPWQSQPAFRGTW